MTLVVAVGSMSYHDNVLIIVQVFMCILCFIFH